MLFKKRNFYNTTDQTHIRMPSLCCGFFIAGGTPGKWIKVNPSLTSQTMRCSFFINPAMGWAGGRNGCIVHTEDSGSTWQLQQTPRNCWVNSIYFHDANEGWVVGKYGLLYTANGGRQWIQRNIGTDSLINGLKIVFLNKDIGWLSYYTSNTIPRLAFTEDGGKTWADRSGSVENRASYDIAFVNDSLGIICGSSRYLARTVDGGKTWTKADTTSISYMMPFDKIQMIDASIGYCLGRNGMVKTIDGGQTWKRLLTGPNGGFGIGGTCMHFSCADTGFVYHEAMYIYTKQMTVARHGATTHRKSQ